MRDILFRAKRKDNGEWVEGYYALIGKRHAIIRSQAEKYYTDQVKESHGNEIIEIIPETLCQYTDLTDKNGKKIWENDIVETVYYGKQSPNYVVVWDESELDFKATNGKERYGRNFAYLTICEEIIVIGNIFDNVDLLEG